MNLLLRCEDVTHLATDHFEGVEPARLVLKVLLGAIGTDRPREPARLVVLVLHVDTAGQVDRFMKRLQSSQAQQADAARRREEKNKPAPKKPSLLKEIYGDEA